MQSFRNLRVCRAAALLAAVAAGCGTQPIGDTPIDSASRARVSGKVYLLRGLINVYSLGLNSLADELNAVGVDAVAMAGPDWPLLAKFIEVDPAMQTGEYPLVLVGHSYGADDAVSATIALAKQNIRVPLLLLLDATNPRTIPSNVDHCVHYYQPDPLGEMLPTVYPGTPVLAAPGNEHTVIENIVIPPDEMFHNLGTALEPVYWLNHFFVDESSWVHEHVIEEVLRLMDGHSDADSVLSSQPAAHAVILRK